jgi:hypothetical protein
MKETNERKDVFMPQKEYGDQNERNNISEYRLTKLEEAVASLSELKNVVLRWDAKFSGVNPFNCQIHQEKIDTLNRRMEMAEKNIDELKKFMYKAAGALIIISIVVQLIGPIILNYIKPPQPQKVEYIQLPPK